MDFKNENTKLVNKKFLTGAALAAFLGIGAAGAFLSQPSTALADAVKVIAPQVPSFADVVENVSPAVVSVRVEMSDKRDRGHGAKSFQNAPRGFENLPRDHPLRKFFGERFGDNKQQRQRARKAVSQGSGFFISEDGYVVTNNHVVEEGRNFKIIDNKGEEYEARLIGTDPKTDLAVLKVDAEKEFTYVAFSEKDSRIGEWVVAVGNPFGLGGTVTAGILSARGRDIGAGPYDDFLQIDAAVNKGNSGGPTFSLDGSVIGVNTAIYSPSGGNVGIAFAVPAELAKEVTDDLIKNGAVVRGWLGVHIQPVTKDLANAVGLDKALGALVVEPTADSPAGKAGLKSGDVILSVNDKAIKDAKKLAAVIASHDPNETVELNILRNGAPKTLNVKLGKSPMSPRLASFEKNEENSSSLESFGLSVENVEGRLTVLDVDPSSNAAQKGIRPGDILLTVNGEEVKKLSKADALAASALKAGRKAVLFQIEGKRGKRFIALQPQDNKDLG